MLLEQHFGTVERAYRTFQIPKEESTSRSDASKHLLEFFGPTSRSENFASLLRSQTAQVTQNGSIRFFSERNQDGYLEYTRDSNGLYQGRIHGEIRTPF